MCECKCGVWGCVHVYVRVYIAAKQVHIKQFNDTQYDGAALGGTRTHNTLLTSQRVLFLLSYQCMCRLVWVCVSACVCVSPWLWWLESHQRS